MNQSSPSTPLSPSTAKPELKGQKVKIQNLINSPELNGLVGVIKSFNDSLDRAVVIVHAKINDDEEKRGKKKKKKRVLAIKLENIEFISKVSSSKSQLPTKKKSTSSSLLFLEQNSNEEKADTNIESIINISNDDKEEVDVPSFSLNLQKENEESEEMLIKEISTVRKKSTHYEYGKKQHVDSLLSPIVTTSTEHNAKDVKVEEKSSKKKKAKPLMTVISSSSESPKSDLNEGEGSIINDNNHKTSPLLSAGPKNVDINNDNRGSCIEKVEPPPQSKLEIEEKKQIIKEVTSSSSSIPCTIASADISLFILQLCKQYQKQQKLQRKQRQQLKIVQNTTTSQITSFLETNVPPAPSSSSATTMTSLDKQPTSISPNLSCIWNTILEMISTFAKTPMTSLSQLLSSLDCNSHDDNGFNHKKEKRRKKDVIIKNQQQLNYIMAFKLGLEIFQGTYCRDGILSLLPFLSSTKIDKDHGQQEKVKALGAVVLLKHYLFQLRIQLYQSYVLCFSRKESCTKNNEDDPGKKQQKEERTDNQKNNAIICLVLKQILEYLEVIVLQSSSPHGSIDEDKAPKNKRTKKRTVLAAISMDVAYLIVECAAIQYYINIKDKGIGAKIDAEKKTVYLVNAIWDKAIPVLKLLLEIRKAWLEHDNSDDHDMDTATRRECTSSVVNDWCGALSNSNAIYQKVIVQCQDHDDLDQEENEIYARRVACHGFLGHIMGVVITKQKNDEKCDSNDNDALLEGTYETILSLGGITQTLCNDSSLADGDATVHDIIQALCIASQIIAPQQSHHYEEEEQEDEILITSNSNSGGSMDLHHIIVRGFASWLGKSKKHLNLLSKNQYIERKTHMLMLIGEHYNHYAHQNASTATSFSSAATAATTKTTTISILPKAVEFILNLLRSKSKECVDLSLIILERLWSSSDGLPPDIFDYCSTHSKDIATSDVIPSSFLSLADSLKDSPSVSKDCGDSSLTSIKLDSSTRAMCYLMKRFIISKPKVLLPFLISRNGMVDTTVEVLVMLLTSSSGMDNYTNGSVENVSSFDSSQGPLLTTNQKETSDDMKHTVGKELLNIISSSQYFRQKLRSKPGMLSSLPISLTLPKLLSIIASVLSSTDSSVTQTTSVVSTISTSIVEQCVATNSDMLAKIMIDELSMYDEEENKCRSKMEGPLDCDHPVISASTLCKTFAGSWRRSLLESPACGNDGYANILVEIGIIMFKIPQSSVPLTLFGAIIGDGSDIRSHLSNDQAAFSSYRERVMNVTQALLELCLDELRSNTDDSEKSSCTKGLFSRLSPLLLLRRIPSSYFSTLHRELRGVRSQSFNEGIMGQLNELSGFLAVRLDLEDCNKSHQIIFSAEERQLSAELAARCLPFFGQQKQDSHDKIDVDKKLNCCYDKICLPAFTELLESADTIGLEPASKLLEGTFKKARAALYAACHYLSLAEDNEEGIGIFAVVSFALKVVSIQQTENEGSGNDNLVQLQTGCIDFFALCLMTCVQRQVQYEQKKKKDPDGPLIQEISSSNEVFNYSSEKNTPLTSASNVIMACDEIFTILLDIVTTSKLYHDQSVANFHIFTTHDDKQTKQTSRDEIVVFSPTARTCLLNSFILAAQRSESSHLTPFARKCLPKIINWALSGKIDSDNRHPLCIAAALQVTFVLITRSKSLDILTDGSGQTRNIWVRRTHKWSLEAIKGVGSTEISYANGAMRLAALKLMLAVVTIDQNVCSEDGGCLSPGEIGETFSVLRGAANVDKEPAVRKMACHVLQSMQKI